MMATTHLDVTTMVVIAAETMSTQPIAASANAWKYVEIHNGKVTISVMMKTTMLDAIGMVEHAAIILLMVGHLIAQVRDDQIEDFNK